MRKGTAIIVIFTIAAFLIACQLSSVRAPSPTDPQAAGTVKDASTNLPIDGALVEISPPPEFLDEFYLTGPDGQYGFIGVYSPYNLTVTKTGYITATATGLSTGQGQVTIRNFSLTPTGILHVEVYDAITALPIEGASVEASGGFSGTTDSGGLLLIYGVPLGAHTVTVSKVGYVTQTKTTNANLDGLIFWLDAVPQNVVPEVPWGTLVASLAMVLGLAGYVAAPRLRRKM
jgi:hypothetical protein